MTGVQTCALPISVTTVEETRELADDLEARVLYMLGKLGIEPVSEDAPVNV